MGDPTKQEASYLDIVASCDDFPYDGPAAAERYYGLYLPDDDTPHGYLLPATVEKMPWTADFQVRHEPPRRVTVLGGSTGPVSAAALTAAFSGLVSRCIERDLFHVLCRTHSEPFAVVGARRPDGPVFVERFATALFGLTTRGAHLVAYHVAAGAPSSPSSSPPSGLGIWISRRAAHLYTYPGMLDATVAGGVKGGGASPLQTLVEEADEEASLPAELVRSRARSRGVLSHMGLTGDGFPGEQGLVTPDYIYVYDMELPPGVVPRPRDDEVSDFYCMGVAEVQAALRRGEFKPDSGAVLVDFLIRHGFISAENERDFVEINMRLHRRLPFRTG
ncbi:NUDIX hydrolase domain-like protein [Xylariomycetidae sp. FL2044]|nr:NUDIX hydrolase domain-like protein [Xylariomycetidae sp. FL2044]